ncbi:hypothetical protein [Paraburkholderia diazotrophica]|uniref:hypothetical protein n=1 Tax=Paraburkholderia diazotrophica TaxID=667676 RepID=UPI001FE330B5|nr:hypothetical protein [Paraburkholderia diazotrophica]
MSEIHLSVQQRRLLDEALSLLIDARSRVLEITVHVCRRQGAVAPDVYAFELPEIIELQRRIDGKRELLDAMEFGL